MSILARPPRAGPIGQAVLGVSLPLDRGRFCSSRPGSSLGSARRALPVREGFGWWSWSHPPPRGRSCRQSLVPGQTATGLRPSPEVAVSGGFLPAVTTRQTTNPRSGERAPPHHPRGRGVPRRLTGDRASPLAGRRAPWLSTVVERAQVPRVGARDVAATSCRVFSLDRE